MPAYSDSLRPAYREAVIAKIAISPDFTGSGYQLSGNTEGSVQREDFKFGG